MPELADYLGLARSLVIYNGRPFRIRKLVGFYGQFIRKGDLCFDIGAHVGTHIMAFQRLGARVAALEPQPVFYNYLANKFKSASGVHIIRAAAGAAEGGGQLQVSRKTPTVSSLSSEWIHAVQKTTSFQAVDWDHVEDVELTTLDNLIAQFGYPRFCKIDVEGYEADVLKGLSRSLAFLSFEHTSGQTPRLEACLERLAELGEHEYNWTVAEQMRLAHPSWVDSEALLRALRDRPIDAPSLDVIARSQGVDIKDVAHA